MTTEADLLISNQELESILASIELPLPGFFDPIEAPFENVLRSVVRWGIWALNRVWSFLLDLGSGFWTILRSTVVPWFSSLTTLISATWDKITDATTWVFEEVRKFLLPMFSDIIEIGWALEDLAKNLSGIVGDALAGVVGTVVGKVQEGINFFGSYLNQVADWLQGAFNETVATIRQEISDPITDFFMDLPERVASFFKPLTDFFVFPAQFWTWFFRGDPGEKVAYGLATSFEWISDHVVPAIEDGFASILGFVERQAPMNPFKAPDMAKGLLRLGAISVGGLTAMTVAGELMHPLKRLGLGNISAMIGDVVGYQQISGIIMGAMLFSGLRTPLNYYFNNLLRPWILERRDFMELLSRRAYTEPDVLMGPELAGRFREAMGMDGSAFIDQMLGFYGFPAGNRPFFEELANTRIGYFALAAVARDGTFDSEWFTESLHRAGYSERVVQRLLDMYQRAAAEKSQGQFASTAFKRFREGLTDQAGFRQELELFAYGPDKIPRFLVAGELDRETDSTSDLVSAYRASFRRGRISPEEFTQGLRSLGITPERVDAYLEQERIWRGGELAPQDEETVRGRYATTAIRAFREGFSTREQLQATLETLGYTPQDILQLTLRGELEYELDFTMDLLAAYRQAFQRDVITEEQFRQALTDLGMVSDRVEGWVFRETVRKFPTAP